MGKRLVEELGLQDGVDTLGRWMAHYLSGLIDSAEHETNPKQCIALQKECVELILRLWERRECLPRRVQPLGHLKPVLNAIETLQNAHEPWVQGTQRAIEPLNTPWCDFAKESYSLDRRISVIAILSAVAESHFGRAKRWLKESGKHLSKNEKGIIDTLDEWLNMKQDWLSTGVRQSIADIPASERRELILRELEASAERQVAAVKQLRTVLNMPIQPAV